MCGGTYAVALPAARGRQQTSAAGLGLEPAGRPTWSTYVPWQWHDRLSESHGHGHSDRAGQWPVAAGGADVKVPLFLRALVALASFSFRQ